MASTGAKREYVLRLFVIAVAVNYVWEMAQMPLYENMSFVELSSWLVCFRASLGDGLIIITIWGLGMLVYGRIGWFRPLRPGPLLLLLVSGAIIAVLIEFHALETQRWAYSALMPIVPLLGIGATPFVQLLVLPWFSMILADRRTPTSKPS